MDYQKYYTREIFDTKQEKKVNPCSSRLFQNYFRLRFIKDVVSTPPKKVIIPLEEKKKEQQFLPQTRKGQAC